MPVIGSSSIIPSASLGPQGPKGVTGIGFTGSSGPTGPTGATGATGNYVVSTHHIDPNLFLTLSDGTEIKIEGLKGNTGAGSTADGVNLGDGVGIFKEVGGGQTFWFKGITSDGSLILYETENTIGISGDRQYMEGATGEISDRLRFVYLSGGHTADVSGLTFDPGLTGTIIFGHGPTGNRWSYDPEEIVVQVSEIESDETVTIYGGVCEGDCGATAGRGVGIQLGVTSGTLYNVQTPIGIAGFTGEFDADEIINFTMLLKGNAIWDWPDNVYFDKQDRFFSCGTDVLNLLSEDGGTSWYGTVTVRGYGTEDCDSVYGIGSCCYIDAGGNINCRDYMTEEACNNIYNVISWNPLSTCSDNCGGSSGVCCSPGGNWGLFSEEGICNNGIGPSECNFFYGKFYETYNYKELAPTDLRLVPLEEPMEIICGGELPCSEFGCADEGEGYLFGTSTLSNKLCVGSCDNTFVSCCKNGRCIGDNTGSTFLGMISPVACRYIYGGVPVEGSLCGEVDCCDYIDHEGACCRTDPEYSTIGSCSTELYTDCIQGDPPGVFMGPHTHCLGTNGGVNEVNCCYGDPGVCCNNGTCSYPVHEPVCIASGGLFVSGYDSCDHPDLDIPECRPSGACCIEELCSIQTQTDCIAFGGTYLGDNTICESDACEIEVVYGCCCTSQCGGNFTGTYDACQQCNGDWHEGKKCETDPGDQPCTTDDDCFACCLPEGVCGTSEQCPGCCDLCPSETPCCIDCECSVCPGQDCRTVGCPAGQECCEYPGAGGGSIWSCQDNCDGPPGDGNGGVLCGPLPHPDPIPCGSDVEYGEPWWMYSCADCMNICCTIEIECPGPCPPDSSYTTYVFCPQAMTEDCGQPGGSMEGCDDCGGPEAHCVDDYWFIENLCDCTCTDDPDICEPPEVCNGCVCTAEVEPLTRGDDFDDFPIHSCPDYDGGVGACCYAIPGWDWQGVSQTCVDNVTRQQCIELAGQAAPASDALVYEFFSGKDCEETDCTITNYWVDYCAHCPCEEGADGCGQCPQEGTCCSPGYGARFECANAGWSSSFGAGGGVGGYIPNWRGMPQIFGWYDNHFLARLVESEYGNYFYNCPVPLTDLCANGNICEQYPECCQWNDYQFREEDLCLDSNGVTMWPCANGNGQPCDSLECEFPDRSQYQVECLWQSSHCPDARCHLRKLGTGMLDQCNRGVAVCCDDDVEPGGPSCQDTENLLYYNWSILKDSDAGQDAWDAARERAKPWTIWTKVCGGEWNYHAGCTDCDCETIESKSYKRGFCGYGDNIGIGMCCPGTCDCVGLVYDPDFGCNEGEPCAGGPPGAWRYCSGWRRCKTTSGEGEVCSEYTPCETACSGGGCAEISDPPACDDRWCDCEDEGFAPPPDTCAKEVCHITWTACKTDGDMNECSRCVLLDPGACAELDGKLVNPKCAVVHPEECLDNPCIGGGRYSTKTMCEGCCVDPNCSPGQYNCDECLSQCMEENPTEGTSFECGLYSLGMEENTGNDSIGEIGNFIWFETGCCEVSDRTGSCSYCNTNSSCLDCNSRNSDCSPHKCSSVASLSSLGYECIDHQRLTTKCLNTDCSGCSHSMGLSCNGTCIEPNRSSNACCWECGCPKTQGYCDNGSIKPCCRCGSYDCETKSCYPEFCEDELENREGKRPSDCYCSACECNEGVEFGIDCPPPISPNELCSGGSSVMGNNTLVQLPDGECIWMMCQQPNCPYPTCDGLPT